jgi:murein DD-endopeptidase MepM/ murein hydrolase activator NlpD
MAAMKKIVLKKDPSRKSIWDWISAAFARVFRERSFVTIRSGVFSYHRLSPAFQCAAAVVFVSLASWGVHATRVYIRNYNMISEKDAAIREAQDKFNSLASDIRSYRDAIGAISKKVDQQYEELAGILHKKNAVTKDEKDRLMRARVLTMAELGYVNKSLDGFSEGISWAREPSGGYAATKHELEKNIVLNENVYLKKRNSDLEKSINDMSTLQSGLVDKIIVLADNNIGELEKTLTRIDTVLSQIQLKDRPALIRRVAQEREEGLGGRYIPLSNIDLADEELGRKFKQANLRVNLWEGLSKAKTMLPLGMPVKTNQRITSHYGERIDPFLHVPAMHSGIDFAGGEGTPLYTTSKGKVTYAGSRGDYGLTVEVYHGMGFSTIYAHLSKISVEKGDIIDEGTKVGLAGSTGRSTAAHLHYEVRYNGRPLNPYSFVKVDN